MGKRIRRMFWMAADWAETRSERLQGWLRKKAEPPRRVKPLAFPTAGEIMLQNITDHLMRSHVQQIICDLTCPNTILEARRFSDDAPKFIKIRMPDDADS